MLVTQKHIQENLQAKVVSVKGKLMMAVIKRLSFYLKKMSNVNDNGSSNKILNYFARKIKVCFINN